MWGLNMILHNSADFTVLEMSFNAYYDNKRFYANFGLAS